MSLTVTLARVKRRKGSEHKFMYEKSFKSELLCLLNKKGIRRVSVMEAKEVFNTQSVLLKWEDNFR